MIHPVESRATEELGDPHPAGVQDQIKELGIDSVESVRSAGLVFLGGQLMTEYISHIAPMLLGKKVEVVDAVATLVARVVSNDMTEGPLDTLRVMIY